jgi:hypothetical protein
MANLIKVLIFLPIFMPPLYIVWRVITFFFGIHIHPAIAVLAILIAIGVIILMVGWLLGLIMSLHDRMGHMLCGLYMAVVYGCAAFGFHGDPITVGVTALIAGALGLWVGKDWVVRWVNS